MKIDYDKFIADCYKLAEAIRLVQNLKGYTSVYGIPKGGILPAFIISQVTELPLIEIPRTHTLIVDDILDSGKTLSQWHKTNDIAVVYCKRNSPLLANYCQEILSDKWVSLPNEKENDIEDNITRIFEYIGENPNREGLQDTPTRIVKMWKEIYRGYDQTQKPKITTFENGKDGIFYDQMITDSGNFYSQCEHHGVPFFGTYNFAYIPDKKILGLSKVARIVGYYSAKLQIQERLVKEIVDEIEREVQPKGIALMMKGRHLCKEMRGAKVQGEMITSDLRGCFKTEPETRAEFINLIK